MKNKYLFKSHISERQFRKIVKYFSQDFDATKSLFENYYRCHSERSPALRDEVEESLKKGIPPCIPLSAGFSRNDKTPSFQTGFKTSLLTNISRITINRIFDKLRTRIVYLLSQEEQLFGEVEIDESAQIVCLGGSYFGARRVRGKRGRGAKGKVPVIGLLKRNGKVYAQIVRNCQRKELMPVIKGKVLEKSTIYTDGWTSYDSLVLIVAHEIPLRGNGYKHYRIHHHENEFARGKNHVNGIESFWSYTKRRLLKFIIAKRDPVPQTASRIAVILR